MDRFASCAKSAVSIEEQSCPKQACVQLKRRWQQLFQASNVEDSLISNNQQLISEISRVKRKLAISQKSKNVLTDELSLMKEELQAAKKKIKNMREIKLTNQSLSVSRVSVVSSEISQKIVIKEKEEQIEMLITSLKEQNREIQSLKNLNIQLNDQISSKNSILAKIQESSSSQLNFYRRQIAELEQTLQLKKKDFEKREKAALKTMEKEKDEWSKMVKALKHNLKHYEEQLEKCHEKEIKLLRTIKELECRIKQQEQNLNHQKEENDWLKSLIEQAKIEYIHKQLVKLENKDKKVKDLQEKKKRAKITQHSYHLKTNTDISITMPSAKTQRNSNNSSTRTLVTPFTISAQELIMNQSQLSALERIPFKQC